MHLNYTFVGVVVALEDLAKSGELPVMEYTEKMLNVMGYRDYHEYLGYLPGRSSNEVMEHFYGGDYECGFRFDPAVDNVFTVRFHVSGEAYLTNDYITGCITMCMTPTIYDMIDAVLSVGKWIFTPEACMFLLQPTMEEAIAEANEWIELNGGTEYYSINRDGFWFCSNWEG